MTARVLIIDNDPRVGRDLQAMLEPLGYRVQITQGVGQALLGQAVTDAYAFRPHVAIVDLRLLDDESDERSGLVLLKTMGSASCILYSAHLKPRVVRKALAGGVASVVGKAEPLQLLIGEVGSSARKRCASFRDWALHWPSAWTSQQLVETVFGNDTDVPPETVQDVLGRLFPKNKEITLKAVGSQVATLTSVSREPSVVLQAWPDDLEPVVVKLAPAERVLSEAENYREHIQGRLVGEFYAHLESAIAFWDLGGTVYRFMGSSLRTLPSFTIFYRKERDPEVILKPLRHLFTKVWSRHYTRPVLDRHLSLFRIYDQMLNLKERLKMFSNQEERRSFPGLPTPLINPAPWVLRHANNSVVPGARQAITHGDLHGDNLFTDGEHAWAIDYERAGPGHILRDFVELEVDIVTRPLPHEVDLSLFYELTLVLAEPSEPTAPFRQTKKLRENSETRKALDVIAGLRKLAYEMTRYPSSQEYLWGLLLDALFVAMLVSEESPQRERALLLGAVLCGRLRHWGEEWPPKDWPPVALGPATSAISPSGKIHDRESSQSALRFDVFLSYQRTDQKAVKYLARRLTDEVGLQPFLDRWHLVPGEPWQEAVEEALDQSRTCAVFWGSRGLGPWQNEEMRAALERRLQERSHRVIPVLLPGCPEPEEAKLPHFLKRVTWVDFRGGLDDSEAFKNLVAGIRGMAPGPDGDNG